MKEMRGVNEHGFPEEEQPYAAGTAGARGHCPGAPSPGSSAREQESLTSRVLPAVHVNVSVSTSHTAELSVPPNFAA